MTTADAFTVSTLARVLHEMGDEVVYDPYDYSPVNKRLPIMFINEQGYSVKGVVRVADSGDVVLDREDRDRPDVLSTEGHTENTIHARVTKRRRKVAPVKKLDRSTTAAELFAQRNELQQRIRKYEIDFVREPSAITQAMLAVMRTTLSEVEAHIVART